MPEAPMPVALAAYIKASIDRDHARDFDLDVDQIVVAFPDVTEVDFEHALTTVAAELRGDGPLVPALRSSRQALAPSRVSSEPLETRTLLPEKTVVRYLANLNTLGVLHPRGASWTTGAPITWQGYSLAAPDPSDIDRHIETFLRDLDGRVADLQRRQPRKRIL